MKHFLLFAWAATLACAQPSLEQLLELARTQPAALTAETLRATFPNLTRGAAAVWGQDFLFVCETNQTATVSVNEQPPAAMIRVPGSALWFRYEKLGAGLTHAYQFFAGGQPLAPRSDTSGYGPDSHPKPGVPAGKLSARLEIVSQIYGGMKSDYWIYASPGVDPRVPSALMVWQDGQTLAGGDRTRMRLFTVTENLVAQKLIPPMVHVLIAPGISPEGRPMRSIEYDTVSDRYARFLMEEVLPEVEKQYRLRPDGYSRAIGGESSGGICSFTAAWFMPDRFARVHSTIGSYTSIQWRPQDKLDGGNVYPFLLRKQPKRNLRVWLSDGTDDLENEHGSWPLQNIQMANSLKMKGYDFHFRFGRAAHNSAQAAIDLPESLTWLWRGYDPAKTSEEFTLDPAEAAKPYYRVRIVNREAW
jgi:enterochelin esterase family protein